MIVLKFLKLLLFSNSYFGPCSIVQQLQSLVETYDCLKEQEASFREQCRSELTRLQALIV